LKRKKSEGEWSEKLLIKTKYITLGSEQAAKDEKGRHVDPHDR
jgi:hypothetical protein